jgi:ketosteroid isomerase-like protein
VRSLLEAFAERDFARLSALLDPEIELDLSRRQLEPVVFHGHEGVREFLRQQHEAWTAQRFETAEYTEVGNNVVVAVRFVSTGREGIEVPARAWFVWECHDGLAVRGTMYQSLDEALKAALSLADKRQLPSTS